MYGMVDEWPNGSIDQPLRGTTFGPAVNIATSYIS